MNTLYEWCKQNGNYGIQIIQAVGNGADELNKISKNCRKQNISLKCQRCGRKFERSALSIRVPDKDLSNYKYFVLCHDCSRGGFAKKGSKSIEDWIKEKKKCGIAVSVEVHDTNKRNQLISNRYVNVNSGIKAKFTYTDNNGKITTYERIIRKECNNSSGKYIKKVITTPKFKNSSVTLYDWIVCLWKFNYIYNWCEESDKDECNMLKPISERTVRKNMLRNGCGALAYQNKRTYYKKLGKTEEQCIEQIKKANLSQKRAPKEREFWACQYYVDKCPNVAPFTVITNGKLCMGECPSEEKCQNFVLNTCKDKLASALPNTIDNLNYDDFFRKYANTTVTTSEELKGFIGKFLRNRIKETEKNYKSIEKGIYNNENKKTTSTIKTD